MRAPTKTVSVYFLNTKGGHKVRAPSRPCHSYELAIPWTCCSCAFGAHAHQGMRCVDMFQSNMHFCVLGHALLFYSHVLAHTHTHTHTHTHRWQRLSSSLLNITAVHDGTGGQGLNPSNALHEGTHPQGMYVCVMSHDS